MAVDPTANYNGKYKVPYQLVAQQNIDDENQNPDLLIHIGEMSDMAYIVGCPKSVWRVSEDGKIVDRFQTLRYIFEMPEQLFLIIMVKFRNLENVHIIMIALKGAIACGARFQNCLFRIYG